MNNNTNIVSPTTAPPQCPAANFETGIPPVSMCHPAAASLPSYVAPICETSDISKEQIINLLSTKAKTKEGAFSCSKERLLRVLTPIVEKTKMLIDCFEKIDNDSLFTSSDDASNITDSFFIEFPIQGETTSSTSKKKKIIKYFSIATARKHTVNELATKLVNIYTIFDQVKENISFRQCRTIFNPLSDLMKEAIETIKKSNVEENEPSKLLRGLKISNQQLARKYLQSGGYLPQDEAYHFCPFCKHRCVDCMPENKNVDKNNAKKDAEYNEMKKKWDEWKSGKKGAMQPVTRTGKLLTKAPLYGKRDKLLMQCHCHQMRCAREKSNNGSTCEFKCMNSLTKKKFEWTYVKGIKVCSCPVCMCKCSKAFAMDDVSSITSELTKRATGSGNPDVDGEKKAIEDQIEAINFISKTIDFGCDARKVCNDMMEKMKKSCKYLLPSNNLLVSIPVHLT